MDKKIIFYKVYVLKSTSIINDELYIFIGNYSSNVNLNKLLEDDVNNEIFSNIFEEGELAEYIKDKVSIFFINDVFYQDDNIQMIKFKIKNYIYKNNISINELYLFGKNKSKNIYENFFDVDIKYSKEDIETLLKNYNRFDLIEILNSSKESFDIKTIQELFYKNDNEYISILQNLSLHSRFKNSSIIYPINPLDLKYFPSNALSNININYETNHKILLLDLNNDLYRNVIYCVECNEFLKYINTDAIELKEKQDSELLVKLYYPIIHQNDIFIEDESTYNEKIIELRNNETYDFKNINELVQLQYDIFNTNKENFNKIKTSSGIINIQLSYLPNIKLNLSLEQIFKKITATEDFPLLKYNPGKKQENIFRLYSNKKNTRGKKIPLLDKSIIFKIDKRANKNKTIVFYLNQGNYLFYIELFKNGQVFFCLENESTYIDYISIQAIMIKNINFFIEFIEPYYGNLNNVYDKLFTFYDKKLQVINIDYCFNYKLKKKLNFKKIIKCFSPVFNLIQDNIDKGVKIKYKKVSNYNEMESIDAFINELFKQHKSDNEIIEELERNFNINYEKAKQHYIDYISQMDLEDDVGFLIRSRNIKNSGFNIIISKKKSNEFQSIVSKIDNIFYIPLISMYLTNLFYVNEDYYKFNASILKICSMNNEEVFKSTIEDIEAEKTVRTYDIDNNDDDTELHVEAFKLNDSKKNDNQFNYLFSNSNDSDEEDTPEEDKKKEQGEDEEEEEEEEEDEEEEEEEESDDEETVKQKESISKKNFENLLGEIQNEENVEIDYSDDEEEDEDEDDNENENLKQPEIADPKDNTESISEENDESTNDDNDESTNDESAQQDNAESKNLLENERREQEKMQDPVEEESNEENNEEDNENDEEVNEEVNEEDVEQDKENNEDTNESNEDTNEEDNENDEQGNEENNNSFLGNFLNNILGNSNNKKEGEVKPNEQEVEANEEEVEANEEEVEANEEEVEANEDTNQEESNEQTEANEDQGEEVEPENNESNNNLNNFLNSINDNIKGMVGGGRRKKVVEIKIPVFIYGNENEDLLKKILNVEEIETFKGYIVNYIKFFCSLNEELNTSIVSITNMIDVKTRGIVIELSREELNKIITHNEKYYTPEEMQINVFKYNKKKLEIENVKGYTFVSNNKEWTQHPSIEYLDDCVKTLYMHWADLDGNKEYHVRDKTTKLLGIYDMESNTYRELTIDNNNDNDNNNNNNELNKNLMLRDSPFYERILEKDPELIVKKGTDKYNQYSKNCQWNIRKQPVILTEEEKKEIDRKFPGSYDGAIKYGSNPDKQFYYICPRFWNFKTNKPMREEDVDERHLIKPGTEIVKNPKEKYIFEFVGKDGKYEKKFPGFIEGDKHPKGLCAPCCFKNVYTPKHIETRKTCNADFNNEKFSDNNEERELDKKKKDKDDSYIKGPDKFPLADNRMGHLMPVLEGFLNFNSLKCVISTKNSKFKDQHPCILRYGVEYNEKSSFVSCLSSLYNEITNTKISNRKMREVLTEIVTIDNILEFHNGNIVKLFDNQNYDEIDISKYNKSKIYGILIKETPQLLNKLINALENFHKYLLDDELIINHTYLWDIVCNPNDKLFPQGINLVILQDNNDDVTNNIDILCPPNSLSKFYFDLNKPSFILYKKK